MPSAAVPPLLLVTEATTTCGAGHAMRLGALGAAWRAAGGAVEVSGALELEFVRRHFDDLGIRRGDRDLPDDGEVVVVDSYNPAIRFAWGRPSPAVLRVLVDDDSPEQVPADYAVIWNPNAYGSADMYPGFPGVVIAGPDHLAIRGDLPRWAGRRGGEIFLTLGGGAPRPVIVEAIHQLDELTPELRYVAVGDWVPSRWRRVGADSFWREAANGSHLITAAGITAWEAAVVGIPVVLLLTAANQRYTYRWGRDSGVPGLNTLLVDGEFLAHQLKGLVQTPGILPRLESGADRVANALLRQVRFGRGDA